jgi:flavin reductase (DIM6/NTAB) family NADH-FMN oxidoreductase RutF
VATATAATDPQREEATVTPHLRLIADTTPQFASMTEFADAMSALASGVVLVTCRFGDRPWGMTVTAFASVSAEPPTILISLGSETTSTHAIRATRSFGVSILAEEQLSVARFGSTPGVAKFLEPFVDLSDWSRSTPVVSGALAHLDCDLADAVQIADHTVLFGRVRAAQASCSGTPLVYHRRTYRTFAEPGRTHRRLEGM